MGQQQSLNARLFGHQLTALKENRSDYNGSGRGKD